MNNFVCLTFFIKKLDTNPAELTIKFLPDNQNDVSELFVSKDPL